MNVPAEAFKMAQWCSENISPIQHQFEFSGNGIKFIGEGWEVSAIAHCVTYFIEDEAMRVFFYLKYYHEKI